MPTYLVVLIRANMLIGAGVLEGAIKYLAKVMDQDIFLIAHSKIQLNYFCELSAINAFLLEFTCAALVAPPTAEIFMSSRTPE